MYLCDLLDTGDRSGDSAEAFWVRRLTVGEGAALNANGLPLYYDALAGTGRIDDVAVLEPASLTLLAAAFWTVAIRRRRRSSS